MAIPEDLNSRLKEALIEALSVANQTAMAVVNPDGSDIGAGGGTSDVNVIEIGGNAVNAGAGNVGTGTQRVTLGNNDPAVVALQIMDDWDESDRAKVNIIAGQAGVTAGAGAVAANTPRMTLADDDPAVVALQSMAPSAMQSLGQDDTGADTYATVKTPSANASHILISLTGANAAIISLDAGVTDHIYVPGGSALTLDNVTITSGVAIQAKNATGGSNYSGLSISIW